VASQDFPPAVFRVNVNSGQVTTLYQGSPFRNPEDVAIDPQRKNVYVFDSDFKGAFPDHQSAIYKFNLRTETLETLWVSNTVCCGLVDILLRPFTGICHDDTTILFRIVDCGMRRWRFPQSTIRI
jgi:hypothetical protein